MKKIKIQSEYITLGQFLKFVGSPVGGRRQVNKKHLSFRKDRCLNFICGTTLFSACALTSCRMPTHPSPLTRVSRQLLLRRTFHSALRGPLCQRVFVRLPPSPTLSATVCWFYFHISGLHLF